MAYCPKAAAVGINGDTGDLAAVVMCDGKNPQQVSGAQSLSGLVFCAGCSQDDHVVGNCPVAAVVDVSSEAEAAAAESVEAVSEPVLAAEPAGAVAAEPVVEMAVEAAPAEIAVPKSQFRSVAAAGVSPQQSVCPELTQPRARDDVTDDVTDLPQEDAGCPTPADSDVIVGAAAVPQDFDYMQAMIEDMARDMAAQENSMTAWGIPGDMFEDEDCPIFF